MWSRRSLKATTAITLVIGLLAGAAGLLAIAGTAFGCEGAAAEIETRDETTHEKPTKFSPMEGRDEEWDTFFKWREEVTVKASILDVRQGNIWEELHRCANGTYKAGESCYTSALVDCLRAGENVEAEELVEIGAGVFETYLYAGQCL
jgi:hypothetical protein